MRGERKTDYGFNFQGARRNPGDPVIVGAYNETENYWSDDEAGRFIWACSKHWPVRRPKSMDGHHGGWIQWLHYLDSRHTFDPAKMKLIPDPAEYGAVALGYEGIPCVGRIPQHIFREWRSGNHATKRKKIKSFIRLLITCMRESEYVEFEEIPNP